MLFNSIDFVLFFPAVTLAYFVIPHGARWVFLLAASYLFYMAWEPGYVLLIMASTLVDFAAGLALGAIHRPAMRRALLGLSLTANLGLLFFFKYYNFFADTLRPALTHLGWTVELPYAEVLLPVGISFYTFQTLSYTIEVYRGNQRPERHLGRFALYVAFFPQLVAGPIERPGHLLPQFGRRVAFDYDRVRDGLQRMLWGYVKKSVIADRLGMVVDGVYANPEAHEGPVLVMATVLFAFQIYCDFSGYTDIALGAAKILGFDIMENFRRPYAARSVAGFWRRWHISLSTWFRDYLYIPLGGNRVAAPRWAFNILVVFALCGLWHGAKWTFVVWGLLHAGYMVVGHFTAARRDRLFRGISPSWRGASAVVTTFALTCFAWIFFRANTFADACHIVGALGSGWQAILHPAFWAALAARFGAAELTLCTALIVGLLLAEAFGARVGGVGAWLTARPVFVRWAVYSAGLWLLFLLGVLRQNEFIYFTF
jgi:D-alanyl-lipoteichoic acid acyltransferase DltB (MBOAT superfamily)